MNYEIDPEFIKDLEKEEADIARHNEYITLCENGGVTPLSYEEWVQFDKKYQEHVRTAGSVLSPATFKRINEVNTNKPTVEQLQSKCEELEAQRDRAIHFKEWAEKECTKVHHDHLKTIEKLENEAIALKDQLSGEKYRHNNLKHKYDQLLVECDKVTYTPVREMVIPSNQPLFPHYYRQVPENTVYVDVYWALKAWDVTDPCVQHAIKKLMAAGMRGAKDKLKDLKEARDSITRALELEETK